MMDQDTRDRSRQLEESLWRAAKGLDDIAMHQGFSKDMIEFGR